MTDLLFSIGLWFDRHILLYWAVSLLAHVVMIALVFPTSLRYLSQRLGTWVASPLVYLASVLFLLFWYRYPWVMIDRELNLDESHWLLQAMCYVNDPVPWRSTYGGTSGPLNAYSLILFHCLGFSLSYSLAHAVSTLLVGLFLLFSFASVRLIFGDAVARPAILPAATFLLHAHHHDLVHLASEYLPLVLLSLAVLLLLLALRATTWRPLLLAFAGMILSCVAFAKLQAVPIGFVIGTCSLLIICCAIHGRHDRLIATIAYLAGVAITPLFFTAVMVSANCFQNFYEYYLLTGLSYGHVHATPQETVPPVSWLFQLIMMNTGMLLLIIQTSAVVLLGLGIFLFGGSKPTDRVLIAAVLFTVLTLIATGYAIVRPAMAFLHYLLFLLAPCTWLIAAGMSLVAQDWQIVQRHSTDRPLGSPAAARDQSTEKPAASRLALVLVFILTMPAVRAFLTELKNPEPHGMLHRVTELTRGPTAVLLRKLADAKDRLLVWGWRPDIYVESGLTPALQQAETKDAFMPCPHQGKSRRRLIDEMNHTRPEWFIDAVAPVGRVGLPLFVRLWGPAASTRKIAGHETFPALGSLVDRNYRLVAEMRLPAGGQAPPDQIEGVRIYRRKENVNWSSDEE